MFERIAVMGVGAIGGTIGGYLTRAGRDVTLIDQWGANVEEIRQNGVHVTAQDEDFYVPAKAIHLGEACNITERFDAIFLAMKSYDTEWATTTMLNHVDPEKGVFVNFQNGINDERMAAIAGVERSLGCVITISAAVYEPGRALRTDDKSPGFKIAEQDGADTARARQLIEVMNSVELTEFSDDLWGERWSKLMINCMNNALSGLSGYGTAEVRTDNDARRTGIQLGAEVARVAGALGIRLHTVIGISPDAVIDAAEGHNLEEVESTLLDSARSAGTGGVPSFGQDVRKGRRTEIDYLNGYVSEKGREIGVPTPFNDRIVDIVHDLGLDFTGDPKHIQPLVEMLP